MSSHSHGSAPHDHAKHPHRHRALSLGAARSRDEARLGITTDYKDLSLHSAAANGNLGLVQYALSHGQPVNSVLNGVLPLHAAASSGNDTIVRMLIEAGADVNSPRLSRRYTREGSKSSGISVGSQGSTPLHFAAANGHLSALVLLLSFGADPRVPEKHGLTPAQMAATNGHRDAAALLHTRANQMDDTDEAGSQASSRSGGGGGSTGRPPSVRSSLSMTRRSSRGGVSAQRSFDALATKLAHASHTMPLHALGLASNSSLHSLASLASSATGHSPHLGSGSPASSSQISLGAVSGAGAGALAGPVTRQRSRPDGGAGSTTRRPSLPSVWEKAAHPRAALRQAFGRGSGAAGAAGRRPSDASVLSEEDSERSGEAGDGAEHAEHRRSLEVHRPLRRDSYQGLAAGGVERAMDPIEDEDDEDDVPTPVQTRAPQLPLVPPQQPPSPVGTLARAASHQFYRPRQSSQLSRSSFGDGHSSFDADSSVFHDDNEGTPSTVPSSPPTAPSGPVAAANSAPTSPTSPRRARATSNPGPQTGARSPLLQQVQLSQQQQQHFHQLQVQLRRSREESGPSGTIGDGVGGSGSTASSRPSTSGSGAADGEWSSSAENEDGGAPYSSAGGPRARGLPSFDVRRTFLDPAASSPASPSPSLQTTAAQNRARSNSASTDGSLAARSSYSFTPSTSTAPTSVGAPSSPGGANAAGRHGHAHGHYGKEAAMTSVPQGRYLAPVYELRAPPSPSRPGAAATSEDDEPKTQAQARSRVQRAERELLALAHEAGASSTKAGSNGSGHGSSGSRATSQRSLKDQLAAYGKSLKVEKELVERDERERRAGNGARKEAPVAPGFTFETISKSTAASTSPSSSAPTTPTPTSVPSWRAIPPVDRLGPPSAVAHGRRSVSPSATSSSAATTTHRRRPSQELDTVLVPAKAASPRSAHHHHHHGADGGAAVPAPARAASPTSTRSGSAKSSSTTTAAAAAASASVPAVAPVLGQGHGGVSFVGVAPKPAAPTTSSPLAGPPHSHAHHHHHHHHPGAQPRTSRSDKSHSERGGAAVAGARKTRDQVEEDRREKAHLEERVPKAVRTVPSERKGFKRWFGSSSAAGAAGASAGKGESAERRS